MKKLKSLKILGIYLMISLISSCATPNSTRVKVLNKADQTETNITVSNGDGGSTSITVSPKVKLDSIKVL